MSGHSKWATIKHKKGIADQKRGQKFTKLIKEISVAARMGGADPDMNAALRTAILKARAENMPKDNIERAIKKGSGEMGNAVFMELVYEGYAPGGVAIIVDTLTDNKNRTAADVRSAFTKGDGNIGTPGCVSFMFDKKGQIIISKENYEGEADDLMMIALDAGAEDFQEEDEYYDDGEFEDDSEDDGDLSYEEDIINLEEEEADDDEMTKVDTSADGDDDPGADEYDKEEKNDEE